MNKRTIACFMLLLLLGGAFVAIPIPPWAIRVAFNNGAAFYWPFALIILVLLACIEVHLSVCILFSAQTSRRARLSALKLLEFIQELAPMLGFLGTLVGLIAAFQQLGDGAEIVDLISSMGVAMTTSLVGVIISMAAYSYRYIAAQWDRE